MNEEEIKGSSQSQHSTDTSHKEPVVLTGHHQSQPATGSGQLRTRGAMAVQHLMAAARFARMSGQFEQEHDGKLAGNSFNEQIAYVSATIMLSVASLEANINEHIADDILNFDELARQKLMKNSSLVKKYKKILTIREKPPLDYRSKTYKNIKALILFRNELVHFKTSWSDVPESHEDLNRELKGKFSLSPSNSHHFPHRYMSYSCAKWAIDSSLEFMKEFSNLSELAFRFTKRLDQLNTNIS
jgi:hypothetical protein